MHNEVNAKHEKKHSSSREFIQVFGQAFAGIFDFADERLYKIDKASKIIGVSPFSIVGEEAPELDKYANCERTNARVKADIRKNFANVCQDAKCDWFVVDNTSALLWLTIIEEQFYTLFPEEKTDFMDDYFNNNTEMRENCLIPVDAKFNNWLRDQYALFVEAVLQNYDADRIILIRSQVPRFRSETEKIVKASNTENVGIFLRVVDNYFIKETNCHIVDTPLKFFDLPKKLSHLKFSLEQDILAEMKGKNSLPKMRIPQKSIADHIADEVINLEEISDYFKNKCYTPEDLAALFWLYEQSGDLDAFESIKNDILQNKKAAPYLYTKNLFERNLEKLQEYQYCLIDLKNANFEDKVVVPFGEKLVLEVSPQNGLYACDITAKKTMDRARFADAKYSCGIEDIGDALQYIEKQQDNDREEYNESFMLRFESFDDLVNSMYFIDYGYILRNDNFVISLNKRRS